MKAWNKKKKPKHTIKSRNSKCEFLNFTSEKIFKHGIFATGFYIKNIKQSFWYPYNFKLIIPRYNKKSYLIWTGGKNDI